MSASTLIRQIREQHGFDDNHSTPSPAVRGLRGKLERALGRLSSDLYNKETHFLLEFIQNADDNSYADDVIPSLNLRIAKSLIVFECNELGFSADNVKAICDIGASTKTLEKSTRGFIGEKGIGFKSVFTVANEVHISSGLYSFHFDRTAQLGMITPVWGSAYPPKPGWTTFHLRLAPSENGTDISAQVRNLRPTLLLFLRQLRSLNVTTQGVDRHGGLQIRREDGPGDNLVSLKRINNGMLKVERYVLVRHHARTPAQEPGREGIEQSEIVLAFPVTETGEPVIKLQDVYAFLPLRCYGFNFIVQADFITSASREDVLTQKEWNKALLRSVVDAFLLAVERFADHPTLRDVWFRYLPKYISDSFFSYIEHKLMSELQHRSILRSLDGTYVRPSQLIILPASFSDDVGAPLIPEAHLPSGFYYLSPDYDAQDRDGFIFRRLGVREMKDNDFLGGLKNMDQAGLFGSKGPSWHESVATCILRLRTPFGSVHPEVTMLRILPLFNDDWALASSASKFMFAPSGVSIPDGLGLQSIAPNISELSARYKLFDRLGVTKPNPPTIATKILLMVDPRSVIDHVAYARFFFQHRRVSNMPPTSGLRLVDECGECTQGDELYLDLPRERGVLTLRDALSPLEARFLHPDYLSAYPEEVADNVTVENDLIVDTRCEWIEWLREYVGVKVVPRVLNGHLTSAFLDRAPGLPGNELLASLCAWWPRLSNQLTQAGARALGEIHISGRRLDRLYLRRVALARADQGHELPFVPVDDPDDCRWDFLERLGVAIRLNAQFFLNKLIHMQGRGENDSEAVEEIYKQLDARFDEDEELIRDAFTKDPIILLVNDQPKPVWLCKMDVYWDGPPSLTIRAVISRTYQNLSNFFFLKLGITSAPPYALVEELRAIATQHQCGPVPPEVQEHIASILADITKILQTMPETLVSFQDLAQIAIFPASVPSEGVTLRTADDFYVPDKSGKYADVFRERVALFALPESAITPIRLLLESSIFKDKMRYLEAHVTTRSMPLGNWVPEPFATDLYSGRVDYIARLVYHTNKASLPQRAKDLLIKLRKITVIEVDSIATILSLGPHHEPTSEDVSFEETDDKFTVFFSRTGILGNSLDLRICQELSRLLEVDMLMLSTCIFHNVTYLHELFEFHGIEEILDDNEVDSSWLQVMLHANESIDAPANQRSLSPASPPSSLLPPPSPSALPVDDDKQSPTFGAHEPKTLRQPTGAQPSHPPADDNEHAIAISGPTLALLQPTAPLAVPIGTICDIGRLAGQTQTSLNEDHMVSRTPGNPVWPISVNFNVPPSVTDDTDLVRVMGEHYAYKMLVRMLDDFGPNNWTSELRHCAPGFAPFRGSAYATFMYDDTRGLLTRKWFGRDKATAWHSCWPRYHIQVKTTRGEDSEPFQMSQVQMITASRFSERAEVGTDIYVILRVSRIGMPEPSYRVYADPHRALFYGQLQHVHEIYLQRNIEPQIGF